MPEKLRVRCNGQDLEAQPGTSVAALLIGSGILQFRASPLGDPRGPLCGVGICMECRVQVDGERYRLACQTLCRDGMEVITE